MSEQGWPPPPTPVSGTNQGRVFGMAVLYGLLLGTVTGAVSGTVAAPVIGTILGVMFGTALALPVSLVAAAVISRGARPPGTVASYRRRLDLTLVVLGVATIALAGGWISLDPLVVPWPALAMLLVVVGGLVVVRPRLRRLAPMSPA